MADIKSEFVKNLAVMDLEQLLNQADVIIQCMEEDSKEFAKIDAYTKQLDIVKAVGLFRYGQKWDSALRGYFNSPTG